MNRQIKWQRCFKIPKQKLNLFLIHIDQASSDSSLSDFEVEYIFENKSVYDVIVSESGERYPFIEGQMEDFAEALANQKQNTIRKKNKK